MSLFSDISVSDNLSWFDVFQDGSNSHWAHCNRFVRELVFVCSCCMMSFKCICFCLTTPDLRSLSILVYSLNKSKGIIIDDVMIF